MKQEEKWGAAQGRDDAAGVEDPSICRNRQGGNHLGGISVIHKHVSRLDPLERSSLRVPLIRVPFQAELVVGLFYVARRRGAWNAQQRVQVVLLIRCGTCTTSFVP